MCIISLALAAGCGSDTPTDSSQTATLTLAYSAGTENLDIWTRDLKGGNLVRVTSRLSSEGSPAWSPDGRRGFRARHHSGLVFAWI